MTGVRLRDGVEVTLKNGDTIVLDGGGGDACVLSHAHGDHLISSGSVVASELTAALAGVRREETPNVTEHPAINLHNAGHIAGSRAAELTDPSTDRTILYTGDFCVRDRFYLNGFEPIDADVLIMETTYGKPEYRFPPTDEVVDTVKEWLADTMDSVILLFGYALGRAQKLQRILMDSPRNRVFVTEAVQDLNSVIEQYLEVSFDSHTYSKKDELVAGDALVLPMQTSRLNWIEGLIERHNAVTAGFSGWAADQSFIYRRGFDEGFVLSDHCDYEELMDVVEAVDPEIVYTHHGYSEDFAQDVMSRFPCGSQPLKRNQSTLTDF